MYPNHMTQELSGRTCCVQKLLKPLKKLGKDLTEHHKTTIHSCGQIFTGRKTAHDFDELFELQWYEKGIRQCTLWASRAAANL